MVFFFFLQDDDNINAKVLSGNKGEWSELYAFFKILVDGRVYAADENYNKIENVFLTVLSVIREEVRNSVYRYLPGETIVIKLNGQEVGRIPCSEFETNMNNLWNQIIASKGKSSFTVTEIEDFLSKIHITKIKSPAFETSNYFGGTIDIMLETRNIDNIVRETGFSGKSEINASATLLNASQDNTNFVFEVVGDFSDDNMNHFNGLFKEVNRRGNIEHDIATSERMEYLHKINANLVFAKTAKPLASENLVKCGGKEMPSIIAGMLKHFYFDNLGSTTTVMDCITSIAKEDVAQYGFDSLEDIYHFKVANFLYFAFTGMRLGSKWNGKDSVNGGYIVVKYNGEVVAYHSTIANEFKEFLVHKMKMEGPSHSRHKDMVIEKIDGKYYLKLALQLRFTITPKKEETTN